MTSPPIVACKDWPIDESNNTRPTAAFLKSTLWNPGETINVSFLGTPPAWKKAWVTKVVMEKLQPVVNVNFVFGNLGNLADIRITFNAATGAYSRLGTQSRYNIPGMPESMNLGWLDQPYSNSFEWQGVTYTFPDPSPNWRSNNEVGAVVLHEFGHALGMIHEHQNPTGGIEWNIAAVLKYYQGYPNYWSEQQVYDNVINKYNQALLNSSEFDAKSIMLYPISAELTLNGVSSTYATSLSNVDVQWLQKIYGAPPGGSQTTTFKEETNSVGTTSAETTTPSPETTTPSPETTTTVATSTNGVPWWKYVVGVGSSLISIAVIVVIIVVVVRRKRRG